MEQSFFKKYKIIIFAIIIVLIFAFGGNLFKFSTRFITLRVWGTGLTNSEFETYAGGKKIRFANANVEFKYEEIKPEEYEKKLQDSFIKNESPDIFIVNNYQLGQFKKLIAPYDLKNKNYNLNDLQKDFPTIIEKEAIIENNLYISPISIDSLALYFNRNLFDSLSIPLGPKNWNEVVNLLPQLRKLDSNNRIERSVIGLGDSLTIKNSADIMALLIMQSNGKIIDENKNRVALTDRAILNNETVSAGENALKFYCDFYQPNSQLYSWNRSFGNDIDAFAQNKLAMFIGYYSDQTIIKQKNPNLMFGVSEMPQIINNPGINFGKFWGFTVSIQSPHKKIAWEILNSLNSPDNLNRLFNIKNMPPAHRLIINDKYNDVDLGVFAKQALNAKSFYYPNYLYVNNGIKEAIDSANATKDYRESINKLSQQLTTFLYNH